MQNKDNKVKSWIQAMRLRTLPLSFSNILLGTAMVIVLDDRYSFERELDWVLFTLTLTTTLLLQILSNLANDYGDAKKGADNEGRIGPERAIQSGAITAPEMLKGIIITAILSLISGVLLLNQALELNWTFFAFIILGLAAIAAAIKYTVGKGAYGYSGLGDLFVFLFFGIVGVVGTMYLQVQTFEWAMLLPATTMGCFSVAVLNLNNMRDRENDQKVGKNTLAVKLGFEKSKVYHVVLFLVAYFVFPLLYLYETIFISASYIYLIPIVPVALIHFLHVGRVIGTKEPKDFDPELKKVALSAFLFGLLFLLTALIFH